MGPYGADDLNLLAAFSQLTALALESAQGHHTIEGLNRDLKNKLEKISEQQRRIVALQSQLTKGTSNRGHEPEKSGEAPTALAAGGPQASVRPLSSATFHGVIGSSPSLRQVLEMARKVCATPNPSAVLIRGESGTGKELIARILHENSPRSAKPFVKVHCAALSAGLLESELFGHVKGAFTGAHKDKLGRFEMANGGTIFLDEIGDINLETQTKLLRVLQEKIFERVGSSEPIQVDVRVIAATHQNLDNLIRQGRFRDDLYYRLNVIDLTMPTLRQRREDIPELASHFLQIYAQKCAKPVPHLDDDALAILKGYHWPGNIRELENVIERAIVVVEGSTVTVGDLPAELARSINEQNGAAEDWASPVDPTLRVFAGGLRMEREEHGRWERERLVRALAAANGNKAQAARAMGLARSTLVSRLKKYGLS
jgi:transcriptional regulator with GAF, ATPase, and Fis domain